MKSFMKKVVASLLVMALCLGGVPFQKQEAKAAESNVVMVLDTRNENPIPSAIAGQPISRSFTLSSSGNLLIGVITSEACNFTYEISRSTGAVVFGPKTVTAMDASWGVFSNQIVYYIGISNATSGTYKISFTFSDSRQFDVLGMFEPVVNTVTASLDTKSLIITKGFKDKVTVLNAGSAAITYTSSNPKTASVDAKGNVTGKKKGTATITVKTSTGFTGTCKVTVKDNVYSRSKLSVSKATLAQVTTDVYKISYDKKGNLVIKLRLINRLGRTAKQLKNFKVTVKNEKGKTIGIYSLKKKAINLRTGKAKALTCKIKKSKLKIKKPQDLRNISRVIPKGTTISY